MSKNIKNEDVRNTANAVEAEVIENKPEIEEKPLTPEVVGEEPKKEGWFERVKKSKAAKIVLTAVGAVGVIGAGAVAVTSVGKKNYNEGYNKGFDDGLEEGYNQYGTEEPDTAEPDTFEEPIQEDYPEE